MKKYLPYIIPIAILGGLVFLAFRKPDEPKPTGSTSDDNEGGELDSDIQKQVIPALDNIMKLTPQEATKAIKGKKIYTKTNTTKIRTENYVNNGFINNIFNEVEGQGVLLGEAVLVAIDKGSMANPNTNRPYKWVKFKLDRGLYDKLEEKKSWYQKNNWFVQYYPWVREDVIKF